MRTPSPQMRAWKAVQPLGGPPRHTHGILASMTRKIAISVADDLLAAVDEESRTERLSRSGFFATAAQDYLDRMRRQREIDSYVASYRKTPETDEEVAVTDAFLARSLAEE